MKPRAIADNRCFSSCEGFFTVYSMKYMLLRDLASISLASCTSSQKPVMAYHTMSCQVCHVNPVAYSSHLVTAYAEENTLELCRFLQPKTVSWPSQSQTTLCSTIMVQLRPLITTVGCLSNLSFHEHEEQQQQRERTVAKSTAGSYAPNT